MLRHATFRGARKSAARKEGRASLQVVLKGIKPCSKTEGSCRSILEYRGKGGKDTMAIEEDEWGISCRGTQRLKEGNA